MQKRKRSLILALALLGWHPVHGKASEWILAVEEPRIQVGSAVTVEVVGPDGEILPDQLELRLSAGEGVAELQLQAVAPQQGSRRRYRGQLPQTLEGTVVAELAGRKSSRLLLLAARPKGPVIADGSSSVPPPAAANTDADPPRVATVEPPLSTYEPMYFIVGGRGGATGKFQLSFKYRLFDATRGWGETVPPLSGLHFGFTQTSIWDLSSRSKPFRDTSYRPALFWQWEAHNARGLRLDALRAGVEHESNGKDFGSSRSINVAFLQPSWHWRVGSRELHFSPRFYGYLDREENRDITDYRGNADWNFKLVEDDGDVLGVRLRAGDTGKGSVQIDFAKRTRELSFGQIGGYFHVQYFEGYGEDLLGYNAKRKSQLRIGVSIVP